MLKSVGKECGQWKVTMHALEIQAFNNSARTAKHTKRHFPTSSEMQQTASTSQQWVVVSNGMQRVAIKIDQKPPAVSSS